MQLCALHHHRLQQTFQLANTIYVIGSLRVRLVRARLKNKTAPIGTQNKTHAWMTSTIKERIDMKLRLINTTYFQCRRRGISKQNRTDCDDRMNFKVLRRIGGNYADVVSQHWSRWTWIEERQSALGRFTFCRWYFAMFESVSDDHVGGMFEIGVFTWRFRKRRWLPQKFNHHAVLIATGGEHVQILRSASCGGRMLSPRVLEVLKLQLWTPWLWTSILVGSPFGRREWWNKCHIFIQFLARRNVQKS